MKKYILFSIIAMSIFATSCTTDNSELQTSNKKELNPSSLQKDGDSLGIDTGGQGGSTPIKP